MNNTERMAADEALVKRLLGYWVSGLEPALACDGTGRILGLTAMDYPIGSKPPILVLDRDGMPCVVAS